MEGSLHLGAVRMSRAFFTLGHFGGFCAHSIVSGLKGCEAVAAYIIARAADGAPALIGTAAAVRGVRGAARAGGGSGGGGGGGDRESSEALLPTDTPSKPKEGRKEGGRTEGTNIKCVQAEVSLVVARTPCLGPAQLANEV